MKHLRITGSLLLKCYRIAPKCLGEKNNLGESAEMILSQKSKMRPSSYGSVNGNIVDEPFRATTLPTGILTQTDRAEYGDSYRSHVENISAGANNG